MQPGLKIGILGGGQLARMLIQQGQKLGLEMHVLCEKSDEPASLVTSHWHKGKTNSLKDIRNFCKKMDRVTFESEFIPATILKSLSSELKNKAFPDPLVLRRLQNRRSQKEMLVDAEIPTSPFMVIHDSSDLRDAFGLFKGGCVVKKRVGGYDGKGTFILRRSTDVKNFLSHHKITDHDFIAESFVKFKRELALQVARNSRGEILFLPLVEIHQKDNRLDYLIGPVTHPRLAYLQSKIKTFLKDINYVGLIAFELFDTGRELVVNEIAPRVHNSGHYTVEALNQDQFTLHLACLLNWPFKKIQFHCKAFSMTNLIGQNSARVEIPNNILGHLHWYGKKQNTTGRKMGHVTYLGNNPKTLSKLALQERKRMKL